MLVFGNTYEYNWLRQGEELSQPVALLPSADQLFTASSLLSLGWLFPDLTVALPSLPSPEWLVYLEERLPHSVKAQAVTHELGDLSSAVRDSPLGTWSPHTEVIPWGLTERFVEACQRHSLCCPWVSASSLGPAVARVVDTSDTKVGGNAFLERVIAMSGSPVRLPETVVVDISQLPRALETYLRGWGAVVLKANRSWGGRGVYVIRQNSDRLNICRLLADHGRRTLDSTVCLQRHVGDVPPWNALSADYSAWHSGRSKVFFGTVSMDSTSCVGGKFGKSSHWAENYVRDLVISCSEELARLGYLGWFDIDLIADKETIFVTEINVRMTGGTVPFAIAEALHGPKWSEHIALQWRDKLAVDLRALGRIKGIEREARLRGCEFLCTNIARMHESSALVSIMVVGSSPENVGPVLVNAIRTLSE